MSRIPFEYFSGGYVERDTGKLRTSPMQLVIEAVTTTKDFEVFNSNEQHHLVPVRRLPD